MANGWKIAAIIFITLFVLETAAVILVITIGYREAERERICQVNICEGYAAFYYESYDQMCYCYYDEEIVKQQYVS